MKMKEFGPRGGRMSLAPPLRSANALGCVPSVAEAISPVTHARPPPMHAPYYKCPLPHMPPPHACPLPCTPTTHASPAMHPHHTCLPCHACPTPHHAHPFTMNAPFAMHAPSPHTPPLPRTPTLRHARPPVDRQTPMKT